MKLSLLPLAAAVGITSFAHADSDTEKTLPTVVVSANRLPETAGIAASNIQIITQEDIQRSGTRNLADLLRQTATIQLIDTNSDGSNPSIGMRGFGENGAQNALILLDGRRLNNDTDIGMPSINNISLDDIDHIEIINGSAGALYGAGAVGGMINIISKPISRRLQAGVSVGSYQYEQYRVLASERAGKFGIQAIGEKTLADNYRDQNGVNSSLGQAKLAWDTDNASVYVEGSRQDRFQQFPGSLFNPLYTSNPTIASNNNIGDFMDGTNERFDAGIKLALDKNWILKLDGSKREYNAIGQLTTGGFPSPIQQDRKQTNFNPQISGNAILGGAKLNVVAGFDSDSADYFFQSNMGSMTNDLHTNAGYAQFRLSPNEKFDIVTGYRHAKYRAWITDAFTYPAGIDIQDNVDAGSLGFYWSPSTSITTWLRADQNFRFALTDEQTGIVFGGQPLKTQEGVSYEGGIKFQGDAFTSTLQLSQLELENEISYDPALFGNINLADTRRRGGNFNTLYRISSSLSVSGEYAYTSAAFTAGPNQGKRVPMVANDNAAVRIDWQAFSGFTLSLDQQRQGKRHVGGDYANSFAQLPALYLVNLGLNYRIQQLETSLRINNLLDKKYAAYATTAFNPFPTVDIAYMPAAERNMVFSINYRFF